MRKLAIVAALLVALPLAAAEKWWDFYKRGVAAVQAGNSQAGIDALQKAISESPSEAASVRPKNETFVYVPHYWLGVAKFQLGDPDGAVREFRASEEQGAVQKTAFYAQLRDWVGKAQSQKQHATDSAAADVKREANAAVGKAVSAQMDAVAAGADRSDAYRAAQRKLQEAMDAANGSDARAFRHASEAALQARDLFAGAAEEAKKLKASRPVMVARQPPPQPQPQPKVAIVDPPKEEPKPVAPAPAPVVIKAELPAPAAAAPRDNDLRDQLQAAYRAFAAGDLTSSEQLLSGMLTSSSTGEAYLLRGCVRYTRSMLGRQPDMRGAVSDFRAALKANRGLRLDRRAFSPKLVSFFEDVKKKSS